MAVDGTVVAADASARSRVTRTQFVERAQVSQTVQEYFAELEARNPVEEGEVIGSASSEPSPMPNTLSLTDPDAAWAGKQGPAAFAYVNHYLIDTASRVILGVEATPARFRQETAARRMPIGWSVRRARKPQRGQGLWERRVLAWPGARHPPLCLSHRPTAPTA